MSLIAKWHEHEDLVDETGTVRIDRTRLVVAAGIGTVVFIVIAFGLPLVLF